MLRSGDSVVLGLVVWRQVTDENVAQLRNFIQQTLNPDKSIRDQAENYLRSVEHTQGFPLLTLKLIEVTTPRHLRLGPRVDIRRDQGSVDRVCHVPCTRYWPLHLLALVLSLPAVLAGLSIDSWLMRSGRCAVCCLLSAVGGYRCTVPARRPRTRPSVSPRPCSSRT